jgi:hypothetical protein
MIASRKPAPLRAGSALVGPAPASPLAGAVLLATGNCSLISSPSARSRPAGGWLPIAGVVILTISGCVERF